VLTARYHITTIQLFFEHQRQPSRMAGQDVDMFAQVLEQCPELAHLDLSHNHIGDAGTGSLQECWCSVQRYLISISAGTSADSPQLESHWGFNSINMFQHHQHAESLLMKHQQATIRKENLSSVRAVNFSCRMPDFSLVISGISPGQVCFSRLPPSRSTCKIGFLSASGVCAPVMHALNRARQPFLFRIFSSSLSKRTSWRQDAFTQNGKNSMNEWFLSVR
jgi:hypothetical protein